MSLMSDVFYGQDGFVMDDILRDELIRDREVDKHGLGREYYDRYLDKMDAIRNSSTVRKAKSIIRRLKNNLSTISNNDFYLLDTIDKMQNPNPVMLNYLMANPKLKALRLSDIINGYREDYTMPGGVDDLPQQNKYYRHVVSGVLKHDSDNRLYNEVFVENSEAKAGITVDDQLVCYNNWIQLLNKYDEQDDDPTSKYNDAL